MSKDLLSGACGLVTVKQAATLVRVSPSTVRTLERRGTDGFPAALRLGNKIFFRRAELILWGLGKAAPRKDEIYQQDQQQGFRHTNVNGATPKKRGRPRKVSPAQKGVDQ